MNQNYNRIRCFVENEIKTTNKICGISKTKYVVSYYKVCTTPLFGQSQVTSSWFQKREKFKIQTNNVSWLVPIQMPCSSKPCTHPAPLTKGGKPNRYPSLWEQDVAPPKKSIEVHKKNSSFQGLWVQCPSNPTWETFFWIKTCG